MLLFSLLSVSASVDARQTPNLHSFHNDHERDNGYDNYRNQNSTVTANFQASPSSGVAPLKVQFTDTSTGSLTSWFWNFGDGTTSTNQSQSTVLHQLDQKIIYPHYDFKHLTEKYFEIGMKLDDFLIQLVKYWSNTYYGVGTYTVSLTQYFTNWIRKSSSFIPI